MGNRLVDIWAEDGSTISDDGAVATQTFKNTGTGPAIAGFAPIAGATIPALRVVASTASQAFISFSGVFASTASVNTTGAAAAFVIPVYHESQKVWGYVTASKGVQ